MTHNHGIITNTAESPGSAGATVTGMLSLVCPCLNVFLSFGRYDAWHGSEDVVTVAPPCGQQMRRVMTKEYINIIVTFFVRGGQRDLQMYSNDLRLH